MTIKLIKAQMEGSKMLELKMHIPKTWSPFVKMLYDPEFIYTIKHTDTALQEF